MPLLDPSPCEVSLQLQVVSAHQPHMQKHGPHDSLEGRGWKEELNCVHVGAFHSEQMRSADDLEEISVGC